MEQVITVYTDGACAQGNMGAGVYINYKGKEIRFGKSLGCGTNQQAELHAIRIALLKLKQYRSCKILIKTDSKYCIGVLSKDWKIKANLHLITSIYREMVKFSEVKFKWVKGHGNCKGNTEADILAVKARKSGDIEGKMDIPVSGRVQGNFIYKTKTYTRSEIATLNKERNKCLSESYY
jgi:ribonuclease HI